MSPRATPAVWLLVVCVTCPLGAQQRARVSGSLETGAAVIEQPLIRGGAALYVAPSAGLAARDFTLGMSGVLASGSTSWRSFLGTGFFESPAVRNIRITGGAQALKTSGLLHTLHAELGAQWQVSRGANVGAARINAGQLRHAGSWYRDVSAGGTIARSRGDFAAILDAGFTEAQRPAALQQQIGSLGDPGIFSGGRVITSTRTQVLDVTPRMIWERSRLRADASIALRAVESGVSGTRVGPQLAFTLRTTRGLSLFAAGTQRLADVRSGVPSGRTAMIGLRVEGRRVLAPTPRGASVGPVLRVEAATLVVDVVSNVVTRVALRGDFTQWQPRTCERRGPRSFQCGTVPPPGTWRVSLRLDDGVWQQPANLAAVADDFGSTDGMLLTGGKP